MVVAGEILRRRCGARRVAAASAVTSHNIYIGLEDSSNQALDALLETTNELSEVPANVCFAFAPGEDSGRPSAVKQVVASLVSHGEMGLSALAYWDNLHVDPPLSLSDDVLLSCTFNAGKLLRVPCLRACEPVQAVAQKVEEVSLGDENEENEVRVARTEGGVLHWCKGQHLLDQRAPEAAANEDGTPAPVGRAARSRKLGLMDVLAEDRLFKQPLYYTKIELQGADMTVWCRELAQYHSIVSYAGRRTLASVGMTDALEGKELSMEVPMQLPIPTVSHLFENVPALHGVAAGPRGSAPVAKLLGAQFAEAMAATDVRGQRPAGAAPQLAQLRVTGASFVNHDGTRLYGGSAITAEAPPQIVPRFGAGDAAAVLDQGGADGTTPLVGISATQSCRVSLAGMAHGEHHPSHVTLVVSWDPTVGVSIVRELELLQRLLPGSEQAAPTLELAAEHPNVVDYRAGRQFFDAPGACG